MSENTSYTVYLGLLRKVTIGLSAVLFLGFVAVFIVFIQLWQGKTVPQNGSFTLPPVLDLPQGVTIQSVSHDKHNLILLVMQDGKQILYHIDMKTGKVKGKLGG